MNPLMFFEDPKQHPHGEVNEGESRGAGHVSSAKSQVAASNHCTADQRDYENDYYAKGEKALASTLWLLLLTRRVVPGINGFEVNRLAVERSCLDVNFVVGTLRINSIPRSARVVSMKWNPTGSYGLKVCDVESSFTKCY